MQSNSDSIHFIKQQIHHICCTYKNRSAGSLAEQECQTYFKEQLSDCCDEVVQEEFSFHPKAFLGWIIAAGLLCIVSAITFLFVAEQSYMLFLCIGFASATAALLMAILEFVFYKKFIDFLFPKKQSINLYACRKPKDTVKRRIIFGGHADAAHEMSFIFNGGEKKAYFVMIGAMIGLIYLFFINSSSFIHSLIYAEAPLQGVWHILRLISFLFVPFFVHCLFFIDWKQIVDGANDNLSGCLVAISVLKELAKQDRLDHTEVCCLITGAEESGLRGAAAFAKQHKEEFTQVETIFIALDTLREMDQLQIYTKGINGFQKNSSEVAQLLRTAGTHCGITLKTADSYPGATDAEAFSRQGLLSCGFCGVNHKIQTYYHTRLDTHDNIDEDCLALSLKICMETVQLYEKYGLSASVQENKNT